MQGIRQQAHPLTTLADVELLLDHIAGARVVLLGEATHGTQEFYRVFSLVNGGRKRETDLFEGLR